MSNASFKMNGVEVFSENAQVVTMSSGVVIPGGSGSLIQTVRNTKSGYSNINTSTTFAKVENASSETFGATINNVLASSKVLILTTFVGRFFNASNNVGGDFGLYRESTIILGQSTLSVPGTYYLNTGVTNLDYYVPQTIMFLDESPATGTNNYFLGYASNGSTSVQLRELTPEFEMILMEIAG